LTQRKAMNALDAKREVRRQQQMEALGQYNPRAKKKR
jgi:hypothetical protein